MIRFQPKYLLLFVFQFLVSWEGRATPEIEAFILEEEHISMVIYYRYPKEMRDLYYQNVCKDLNTEIAKLKEKGLLKRGKIEIRIMTAIWMDHDTGMEMYRFKSGYYCYINGVVQSTHREYLRNIVHYFASDSWESFCYNYDLAKPKVALAIFNRRLKTIQLPPFDYIQKLKDMNNVSFYYENGSFSCRGEAIRIDSLETIIPFSHKNKDFVLDHDTLYVIENGKLINSVKSDFGRYYSSPFQEQYMKWINFKTWDGCFLSYNIPKNKFYILKM